jgi:hypothetical protein
MSQSLPKLLDPVCLNCGHLWSKHFVNDPDPRCCLRVNSITGSASWCNCVGFRGGCAKCNHPRVDHGTFEFAGMCHHVNMHLVDANGGWPRCTCDGYEPSR